jgi:FkbM family methyltransferase
MGATVLPPFLAHQETMIQRILGRARRVVKRLTQDPEQLRLESLPRFQPTETTFLGRKMCVPDACTYLGSIREIFGKGVYRFNAKGPRPRIIDCGANIGMSVINFKTQHPDAVITAFEPDPNLFAALQKNVASFGFKDVTLQQKAVWIHNDSLQFNLEGGASGRIAHTGDANLTEVPTARLRDLLGAPVDFLKIDVEGSELELLEDCRDRLGNVGLLFVEYHSYADQPQRLDDLLRIVRDAGFRYDIKEEFSAPHPFVTVPTQVGFDLQLSVSCYRR